ncbi:serine-rich adhesin for platelets isoform X1 [Drosophila teissieri]|uniref:serine-rich adhesin for platelets isoform X1 n=1 Tax=Drosophila teissieri TaxID=7243 RepID=UPI001CBA303A|nr:serine-rich adhesin for platelets isoform X1 [Drosophila teissieri]
MYQSNSRIAMLAYQRSQKSKEQTKQQMDDPPSLPVGTEVSAKYKGAFCEAKVSKVVRNIKVKVAYKQGLGSGIVPDDAIKAPTGQLRVGAVVEVRHPDRKELVEATITKIQDISQYTVVFDDGDITTLRRTALCLKSGRHFNESETLDQLPLTHPEHFGNPVVGGRRGRRRGHLNEDSSEDDDESDAKEVVNEKEENIGKVVCVETESKKKDKEKWFPALVVAPTAQATVRIRVKDEYLVRSFKDGRYYTVPKKEATEFTREVASKQDVPAVQAALEFLDSSVLPAHWDRDSLFGLTNISSDDEGEIDSDSSDDEPHEEKDRFVAQLYKYMDDRGTPLNKVPSILSRDVDLYRLFRAVQKRGGYNRVTSQNQWKLIAMRLGFTPCTVSVMNLVKQAYKKFLQPYGDFHRKLGCSMLMTSRNSNRSKGRSLVRANSVASPKPMETTKTETISKLAQPNHTNVVASTSSSAAAAAASTPARAVSTASQSAAEESGNTSESSVVVEPPKKQRKGSAASSQQGKVKSLVEKYEEKSTAVQGTSSGSVAASGASGSSTAVPTTSAAISTPTNSSSATSGGSAAVATTGMNKDAESDLPLAKIKAAAVAAASTRHSMEKETNISSGSSASASSKANSAEMQRSRDASPSVAAPPSAGTSTSGGAAAPAQPTSTKKEKHQRSKQADKEKDKDKDKEKEEKQASSGKRKKEKISVEKIDTGDFVVGIGDKLKVNYHEKKSPSSHGSTYEAKVIEISVQRGVPMYLVHYTGWNNRYDEWVPRERIAENLTKGSKQKTRTISTSSANSGSGGGGGGGSGGSFSVQGSQPPGVSDKHQPGKDGCSKMPPSSGNSTGPGAPSQSGPLGGASSTPSLLSTVVKTPTTGGAKRGRGRSDSMPPRSTTPSSVVTHSGRTKSPAASQPQLQQQMKKRPTRVVPGTTTPRRVSDASMASESDSDSDEPVRRPKRQSTKDKPQAGKAPPPGKGRVASRASSTAPAAHPSDDSEDDEEEEEPSATRAAPSKQQQQQAASLRGSRAGGNRAMSSGAASAKGRDYDLSEIRSELKGFQPKLLTNAATNEERKDLAKKEPSDEPALQDIKKEPKLESSAKSSSTELSSETESYADEDSQSSDYRKQPKGSGAGKKEPTATPSKLHHEPVSKRELAVKEEPLKIEPKTEPKDEESKSKPFLSGADIKPTALIAPARFGNTSAPQAASSSGSGSTTAKYTSVIVEKPLTIGGKKSVEQHVPKKAELLKKQSGGAGGTAASSSLTSQESKKFAEPVASLKVEMPAACSPSSSSSSSSSFCSTGSAVSSSSATRSLPDMSKLEISSGTVPGPTPGAAPSQSANATQVSSSGAAKESKYSSSGGAAAGSGISMRKLLSSDVYEFKDTEPFEFEKRISPMASVGGTLAAGVTAAGAMATAAAASVITTVMPTPAASGSGGAAGASTSAPVVVGSAARKQALKASAIQHILEHQGPTAGRERGYGGMTSSLSLLTAPKLKKRGSPLKEPALCLEKSKIFKLDKEQVQQPVEQKAQQLTAPTLGPVESYTAGIPEPMSPLSTPTTSSGHAQASGSSTYSQLTPHHATPFDALRKSPSFNLNITALNEELAQTVQETTRALTDALQPPTTPGPPPVSSSGSTATAVTPVITPTPTAVSAALSCPSTPPTGANPVLASPKLSTPPQAINASKQPPAPHIVGSPFIETRNVFELSTSNEGSGYSSGESKDNKFEKLENVKILLAGAVGPFDLDAGSYEQKTSSIADKVLKAISQKKEEVENNKSKPPVESASASAAAIKTPAREEVVPSPTVKLELCSSAIKLDTLKLLSEPLKIQTGPLLGELYRPGPATSSPETKSILESSLPAKNSELSETIQKLECAIQQRKTPVGGALSLASSTAGTPPTAHTPNSTATAGAGFSDESMDSTDSEQRLVIEDVIAEEHTTTTTTGEQKSPGSQQEEGQTNTATMATAVTAETEGTSSSTPTPPVPAPVKLELGAKAMPGIQAPIPLKPAEGSSFAGKLSGVAQPPPLAKLQQQEEMGQSQGQSKSISSFGIPIVLPEIPASVVVATPALMVASAATVMRHSPGSTSNSPAPVLISPKTFLTAPKVGEVGGLLLKAYTGVGGTVVAGGAVPAGSVIAAAGGGTPTVISNFTQQQQQQQAGVAQAAPEMAASYVIDAEMADAANSSAPVVARPFVMHPVNKELFNVVAPAASSPLISDPHNESINLLCEETIPGSPAPIHGGTDQLPLAVNSALAIVGITPLPPDTPPPVPVAAIQQQHQLQSGQQQQQAAKAGEVNPSAPNSSPDSASQDESGEETKKNAELEHEDSSGLGALNKRKRTRKPLPMSAQTAAAVAAQLQSLGKRRRQVSGMRNQKTTTATAGSDTDDNSDNIAPNAGQQQQQQRQSARQQMMPQGNAQQQLLQQQQTQLQQGIQSTNSSGVRPCPYNFLVELDPALSSDECITILRKQIQDLRKAYNTIKGELAVIDRRRKKLRRREREKKQQQLHSQQQGKICA